MVFRLALCLYRVMFTIKVMSNGDFTQGYNGSQRLRGVRGSVVQDVLRVMKEGLPYRVRQCPTFGAGRRLVGEAIGVVCLVGVRSFF